MSQSSSKLAIVLVAGIWSVVATSLYAQTPSRKTVTDEVQALVSAGEAVGLVIEEGEMDATADPADSSKSDLPSLSKKWGRWFEVSRPAAVVNFRSRKARQCAAPLSRHVAPMEVTGTPLEIMFALVENDPAAPQRMPPGTVGKSGTETGRSKRQQHITLRVGEGTSLQQALDRMVVSGLPLGWGVVERESDSMRCQLLLFSGDVIGWTPYDLANSPSRGPK